MTTEPTPLTFGRYMVEGGKAYGMLADGDVSCPKEDEFLAIGNSVWNREYRVSDITADILKVLEFRRPLPADAATYAILQAAWCEHFGVKVGTRVRVVRKAEDYEVGWDTVWRSEMDAFIGTDVVVEDVSDINGFYAKGASPLVGHWWFPFHVLEVLEPLPAESAPQPPAGSEGEDFTVDDYATAARVIALHLDEFCDKSKLYPDMIADAARKASAQLTALRSAAEGVVREWRSWQADEEQLIPHLSMHTAVKNLTAALSTSEGGK